MRLTWKELGYHVSFHSVIEGKSNEATQKKWIGRHTKRRVTVRFGG